MRIWDQVEPKRLCRQHLLSEHRELHGLWSVLSKMREGEASGYSRHPEVVRWIDHEAALAERHNALVEEMLARGYKHNSPLPGPVPDSWDDVPDPYDEQEEWLSKKGCECEV